MLYPLSYGRMLIFISGWLPKQPFKPTSGVLELGAETEGFEPSVPVRELHLSRVVH